MNAAPLLMVGVPEPKILYNLDSLYCGKMASHISHLSL